jgi:hypothetical protein
LFTGTTEWTTRVFSLKSFLTVLSTSISINYTVWVVYPSLREPSRVECVGHAVRADDNKKTLTGFCPGLNLLKSSASRSIARKIVASTLRKGVRLFASTMPYKA